MATKDTTTMITEGDYRAMAERGRAGTKDLTEAEARAVIRVRFDAAASAYRERPTGEAWRKLMEAVAALQDVKGS